MAYTTSAWLTFMERITNNMRLRNFLPMLVCVVLAVSLTTSALAEATKVYLFPSDVPTADYDGTPFWTVDYFDQNPDTATNPIAEIEAIPELSPLLDGFGASALKLDPGTAFGGSGCAGLGGKAVFGTTALAGRPINSITSLGYSFLITVRPSPVDVAPYINIFVDVNEDGNWHGTDDSILIYAPETNDPNVIGQWQTEATTNGLWKIALSKFPGFTNNTPYAWSAIITSTVTLPQGERTIGDLTIANPVPGCNGTTSTEGSGLGLSFIIGQKNGDAYNSMITYIDAITLAVSGAPAIDSVYDLTLVGPPANIVASGGSSQNALIETAFGAPLEVTVTDEEGNPLEGLEVSFTAPDTGATAVLSAATATTDAQGKASVTATANATTGAYNVNANIDPALPTAAVFSLKNVKPTTAKPSKPVLVSPINGAVVSGDSTPLFQWNANPIQQLVTDYRVKVFKADNVVVNEKLDAATVCVFNVCTLDLETLDPAVALDKGIYKWSVTAINEEGSNTSELETFVNDFPGKPVLTSPIDGLVVNDVSPVMTWEEVASAAEYRLKITHTINENLVYTTPWLTSVLAGCNGTACGIDLETLTLPIQLGNGSYKWFVEARNTGEVTGKSKSKVENFAVQFPGKPTLISPDNNAPVTVASPIFTFSEVVPADEYRLVIVRKSNGKVTSTGWLTLADVVCDLGTCTIDVSALDTPIVLKNGQHQWYVEARNAAITPNKSKSAKRNFTVAIAE